MLFSAAVAIAHGAVIVGLGYHVIMRRRPVGVTLAWLMIIVAAPFLGAVLYLMMGQTRLGERNVERIAAIRPHYAEWQSTLDSHAPVDWAAMSPENEKIHSLGMGTIGAPALSGNRIALVDDAERILRAMIEDIDRAKHFVHMQFYIWHRGGTADEVGDALVRAAKRGVACRVLLDSIGSRPFFGQPQSRTLREAGVRLAEALPTGLLRSLVARADHRLHRKCVVIDGDIGYTGSLNLVDPRFFNRDAGVGEWIDAMARIEGPAVEALAGGFIFDWELVVGEGLEKLGATLKAPDAVGPANVQVVHSGPAIQPEAIHQLILTAIYSARNELILTSPYFVPSAQLVTALESAASRGVDVTIVLPKRNDSFLVYYASRSTYTSLMKCGVRIAGFTGGLLHTKSITIDGATAVFGSVNLDLRSFYLNFEISLLVYDRAFTRELRALQHSYIENSETLDLEKWERRPTRQKLVENICHLASPLL